MVPTHSVGMEHGVKLPKCSGVSLRRGPSACDAKDCPVHFAKTAALLEGQPDWFQEARRGNLIRVRKPAGLLGYGFASDLIVDL